MPIRKGRDRSVRSLSLQFIICDVGFVPGIGDGISRGVDRRKPACRYRPVIGLLRRLPVDLPTVCLKNEGERVRTFAVPVIIVIPDLPRRDGRIRIAVAEGDRRFLFGFPFLYQRQRDQKVARVVPVGIRAQIVDGRIQNEPVLGSRRLPYLIGKIARFGKHDRSERTFAGRRQRHGAVRHRRRCAFRRHHERIGLRFRRGLCVQRKTHRDCDRYRPFRRIVREGRDPGASERVCCKKQYGKDCRKHSLPSFHLSFHHGLIRAPPLYVPEFPKQQDPVLRCRRHTRRQHEDLIFRRYFLFYDLRFRKKAGQKLFIPVILYAHRIKIPAVLRICPKAREKPDPEFPPVPKKQPASPVFRPECRVLKKGQITEHQMAFHMMSVNQNIRIRKIRRIPVIQKWIAGKRQFSVHVFVDIFQIVFRLGDRGADLRAIDLKIGRNLRIPIEKIFRQRRIFGDPAIAPVCLYKTGHQKDNPGQNCQNQHPYGCPDDSQMLILPPR